MTSEDAILSQLWQQITVEEFENTVDKWIHFDNGKFIWYVYSSPLILASSDFF